MIESAIREKTRPSLEHHCHCEASSQTGRGNPRLFYAMQETLLFQGGTDSHVASLNATAAYHDSLICRLVPLGGMTVVFFILPFLLPNGSSQRTATPQSLARQLP